MIRDLIALVRLKKEITKDSIEANEPLLEYFKIKYPQLIRAYLHWFGDQRTINAASITKTFNEAICDLENQEFDSVRRDISYFAGATARISDDLTDNKEIDPHHVFLLNSQNENSYSNSLGLFYALNLGLESLLPFDYLYRFRETKNRYNQSQVDSLRLFEKDVTYKEIIDIKNRTGGYSAFLLYTFMFPEIEDPSVGFNGDYNPNGNLPITKEGALYNLGAWLSRIDDLYDKVLDNRRGMKQLATEGLVTWKELKLETQYTFDGLGQFYPYDKSQFFRMRFKPFTNKFVSYLFN